MSVDLRDVKSHVDPDGVHADVRLRGMKWTRGSSPIQTGVTPYEQLTPFETVRRAFVRRGRR
jgi:hypothetical protein